MIVNNLCNSAIASDLCDNPLTSDEWHVVFTYPPVSTLIAGGSVPLEPLSIGLNPF